MKCAVCGNLRHVIAIECPNANIQWWELNILASYSATIFHANNSLEVLNNVSQSDFGPGYSRNFHTSLNYSNGQKCDCRSDLSPPTQIACSSMLQG